MPRWLTVCALLLLPAFGRGQSPPPRPTVGLALSGGGARGMAHIGVLRWFEEHRIPIDYVAGTSMGGLVGGMYAMGMTPEEMTELVEATDWSAVLGGSTPYPEASFRRKQDRSEFASGIEFGLRDGGLRIPRGLNAGHTIGLIFDRAALPYDSVGSFDDLPIPFRSLATELGTGELVVFSGGSVSAALRATMSIPGMFTPVVDGDRLYADGGLLNNIPTDVVRRMGADVVIAVDIGTPLADPEDLDNLFGILSQSLTVTRIQNDRRNLELADIVLAPDLGDFTLLDFTDHAAIIARGYAGAEAGAEMLAGLALDEEQWPQHLEARRARQESSVPIPREITVIGTSPAVAEGIGQQLANHLGRPVVAGDLERDLTRIVGNGRFASMGYRISPDGQLLIDALEQDYGPPFGDFSLDVDTATGDPVDLSIGVRVTAMDIGTSRSEWRTDLKLGTVDLAATEYFVPLASSRWFVAPRAWWRSSHEDLFDGDNRIAQLGVRQIGVGFDIGYDLNRFSEIRAGFELQGLAASIQTGDPAFPALDEGIESAFVRWIYDGQDRPVVPIRGVRIESETRWFSEGPGLTADLIRTELSVSALVPVSERGSVFVKASGGRDFRRDALLIQQFSLGGFSRLTAWDRGAFRAGRYGVAAGGYMHDLGELPRVLGDRLYAAAFVEGGRLFGINVSDELLFDGALAFGTRSPLGALWVGGAVGEGGRTQMFFRLGRFF